MRIRRREDAIELSRILFDRRETASCAGGNNPRGRDDRADRIDEAEARAIAIIQGASDEWE